MLVLELVDVLELLVDVLELLVFLVEEVFLVEDFFVEEVLSLLLSLDEVLLPS